MMKVTERTKTPGDFLKLVDFAINNSYCLLTFSCIIYVNIHQYLWTVFMLAI